LSQRRSRLELTLSVLESIRAGIDKPTRIMYDSNLSWEPTRRILSNLVDQGFLSEMHTSEDKRSSTRYAITEKGLNVLEYFGEAKKLIDVTTP
jgi:predicted transcriptional regulator